MQSKGWIRSGMTADDLIGAVMSEIDNLEI
jgi:hypothetical protein